MDESRQEVAMAQADEGTGPEVNPYDDPEAQLTQAEEADLIEAEATAEPVTYSGQDFDVAGLVRRLESDDILIPTFGHNDERIASAGFQRSFVWTKPQMDRFVESLLLGYPVPGIFLVRQSDRRYLVLDGQQRLRTLQQFVDGLHDARQFSLANVADEFKGLTYKSLPEDLRRQFDDTFLQATIVTTDGSTDSLDVIYKVFERVNSGGTQLTPHEIRVALYAGPFIDFLEQLNLTDDWRELYGKKSPRLRDQELVLRVLALIGNAGNYRRPLKSFLNSYVGVHRQLEDIDTGSISESFVAAASVLRESGGRSALRPGGTQLNAALTEAIFVGLIRRLSSGMTISTARITEILEQIGSNENLATVTTRATADEDSVRRRLEIATEAFAAA